MSKYTDEEIELLKEEYDGSPEKVLELSKRMNKTVHSLRSKLCNLGIYVSPFSKPKYGTEKVLTKEALVSAIENQLFDIIEEKHIKDIEYKLENLLISKEEAIVLMDSAKPQPISLGSLTKAGKLDLVNLAKALGIKI